jgi:pimeloyl-ACP methyl ester carboxylesterase
MERNGKAMILAQLGKKIKRCVFNILIGALRKSANLDVGTASLNVGQVVYLDNVKRKRKEEETLIFIHGLGADKDTWLQLTKYLTKNYRIVIPDLPGHGQSTQDFSLDYGVKAQALRILELLKLLKIERAHIAGSSMGGAIAIRIADIQPEAVLSLILIDSYGAIMTPSYIYRLTEETGHNPMLDISNKDDYKKMLSLAMVKPPYIPGFIIEILVENMKEKQGLNKKIYKDSEVDSDLIPILPKLVSPSLVIWGAEDKVLHVDNAEIFHRELHNCSKVVLEATGHVPMVEEPEVTATYISKFVNEVTYVRGNNI